MGGMNQVDSFEIMRQREIGKQIMLVDIIQSENDLVKKHGIPSYTKIKDLAKWANMKEEDVEDFAYACRLADTYFVHIDALGLFPYIDKDNKDNERHFLFCSCDNLKDIIFDNVDDINNTIIIEVIVIKNFIKICEHWPRMLISEKYADVSLMGSFVEYYICYYVKRIKKILSMGYDWDVVCKMLRYNLSKDKYYVLEEFSREYEEFSNEDWKNI